MTLEYWAPIRAYVLDRLGSVPLNKRLLGISAEHGCHALKLHLIRMLRVTGYGIRDFGSPQLDENDDYPDYTVPLAHAVGQRQVALGIAICASGVGAAVVANKIPGVRACLIHEVFSAHQGVEEDDLNLMCLGVQVIGHALAWDLVQIFLAAEFNRDCRHRLRLGKIVLLETMKDIPKR